MSSTPLLIIKTGGFSNFFTDFIKEILSNSFLGLNLTVSVGLALGL